MWYFFAQQGGEVKILTVSIQISYAYDDLDIPVSEAGETSFLPNLSYKNNLRDGARGVHFKLSLLLIP
jgi:hypothetical protein